MVKTLMYMTPNYSYWSRDRSHMENRNLKNWPHSRARERERERERERLQSCLLCMEHTYGCT